jgi:hypothetical protein
VFITAIGIASLILFLKFGWHTSEVSRTANQNIQAQTGEVSNPSQTESSKSAPTTTAATVSDLRGTWAGTYGPLGSAATLVIKSHKGRIVEGELSQGPVIVAFTGTVDSDSINLKQTRVLRGDGWSLGEDSGTISADGKTISGTGTDTTGGPLGMSYQWTFRRH